METPRALADAVAAALAGPCGLAPGTPLLLAVSGGLDSVALAESLAALGWPATLAYVHHHLRGADADADAAFVEALAARLGRPFARLDAPLRGVGNRQDEARRLRYRALAQAAVARELAAVATAHTATDQAETLLLHLVRGTGAHGLAGMAPSRPLSGSVRLVRPLLGVPRAALAEAAAAAGWRWREDASNAGGAYRRNRLRRDVLPLLRAEAGPGVDVRMAQAAEAVRGLLALDAPPLDVRRLAALPDAERRAAFAAVLAARGLPRRRSDLVRLAALVGAQPGRRVALPGAVAWREREHIVLVPDEPWVPGPALGVAEPWPVAVPGRTATPHGVLVADVLPGVPPAVRRRAAPALAAPAEEVADAAALHVPLVLRPWCDGDRMRPLGAPGSRLVSDVLTDARVPSSARRRALVLVAGETPARAGTVLWLVGVRLAEAARLHPESTGAVRLRWTPAGAELRRGEPPEGA